MGAKKGEIFLIIALIVFLITYVLMLSLPKLRHWIALGSAGVFLTLGLAGVIDYSLFTALGEIDFNVLLMIGGTMGLVQMFIDSRMRVSSTHWRVCW